MELEAKAAAAMLRRTAALMEIHGDNPHRVRAFANAARAVEKVDVDLAAAVDSGEILEIRGIGTGTAAFLGELATGDMPGVLADLDNRTPSGVQELLEIAGLGPKKVRALWVDLGVSSVGELEYACRENRLVELPGFGAKSQLRVLDAVEFRLRSRERLLLHQAWRVSSGLADRLREAKGIERVEVGGEVGRCCETAESIELVVVAAKLEAASDAVELVLQDVESVASGAWSGTADGAVRCRVWWAPMENAGVVTAWVTGSEQHVEALRRRAQSVGKRLERDALYEENNRIDCPDELRLYEELGCQWVPPELREDGSEVERAANGRLSELAELVDFQGAVHNHTTDSDGSASVVDMASAAAVLGWTYFGVADHSPAAHYANGLSAERLLDQTRRIDEFNRTSVNLRILKGIEADILGDGALDVPEGCESALDYVVASVHSSFRLSGEAQTSRIIRALRHPACRVLGHPTGRLLLARPGYAVDLEAVLTACAESGVAAEINASPYRLDLDWRWARRALEIGVPLVVNPDAHAVDGLADVRWGLSVARKAGAGPEHLLNCRTADELLGGWSTDR